MPILTSSGFTYKDDFDNVFTGYLEDDGYGKIRMWKTGISGEKVLVYYEETSVGTINYNTGKITLKEFRPITFSNNTNIKLNVKLRDSNVFANRSRILTLDRDDPESVILSIEDMNNRTNTASATSSY